MAQRDQIGHHQPDEGNRAHHDHAGGHRHRHQHQPQRGRGGVAQTQAGGHFLAHAQHGEAVRVQIGQGDHRQHQIQDFVAALHHAREIAQQPTLHALQDVVAVGVELGHGAEHAAVHQADDGHQHRVAELDAADDGDIEHAGREAEGQREQHAAGDAGGRRQRQRYQDAELGGVQSARGAGLDKTVAHDVLQDHAADGQAHAGQHQRRQARQPAGRQRQPGVARHREKPLPFHLPRADQHRRAAQCEQQQGQAQTHQGRAPSAAVMRQPLAAWRWARNSA